MAARSKYLSDEQHFSRGYDIDPITGCWMWRTQLSVRYPGFYYKSRCEKAHRVSYIIHVGEIPYGLRVCHKCDNTRCVNPGHLFLGTQSDNLKDMGKKGRHGATKNPHAWAARIGAARSKPGETNPAAKLTETLVAEIRARHNAGEPYSRLADTYKVGKSTIARIVTRQKHGGWTSVK